MWQLSLTPSLYLIRSYSAASFTANTVNDAVTGVLLMFLHHTNQISSSLFQKQQPPCIMRRRLDGDKLRKILLNIHVLIFSAQPVFISSISLQD